MEMIKMFLKELDKEAVTTRKMLDRVPDDKYNWQPHPKSMTISQLVNHIAELPEWIPMTIHTDGLDFAANPYKPAFINDTKELIGVFNENIEQAKENLWQTNEDVLGKNWVLRNGDTIIMEGTKADFIRVTFNQITHHRAQLGVYLRLLNIPIPGSYGPSADELEEMAAMQA